jgi:DNA-binding NtrC family response regulator
MPVKSVFVVDDEPVIVMTVVAILNREGFHAEGFKNAETTLQAVNSGGPDLLITDVAMPGMNGVDLAIRFQTLCPDCKIILLSGHIDTGELLAFASSQGHDFAILAKAVHPEELLAAISNL